MSRKPRGLRPEERAIWDQVTQTLRPLHKVELSVPETDKTETDDRPVARRSGQVSKPPIRPRGKTHPPVTYDLASDPSDPIQRSGIRMDAKAYGKMKRGKLGPEARIDLHGMTAARAHIALNAFISQAYSQGLRLVLVITGKGETARRDPDAMSERKGVLRHGVPQWLAQAPLHHMVLQVSSAHQSHGGTGAYYVYLRRNRS